MHTYQTTDPNANKYRFRDLFVVYPDTNELDQYFDYFSKMPMTYKCKSWHIQDIKASILLGLKEAPSAICRLIFVTQDGNEGVYILYSFLTLSICYPVFIVNKEISYLHMDCIIRYIDMLIRSEFSNSEIINRLDFRIAFYVPNIQWTIAKKDAVSKSLTTGLVRITDTTILCNKLEEQLYEFIFKI